MSFVRGRLHRLHFLFLPEYISEKMLVGVIVRALDKSNCVSTQWHSFQCWNIDIWFVNKCVVRILKNSPKKLSEAGDKFVPVMPWLGTPLLAPTCFFPLYLCPFVLKKNLPKLVEKYWAKSGCVYSVLLFYSAYTVNGSHTRWYEHMVWFKCISHS